ncbi:hypothetical protein DYH52_11505 [Morganella morganii]|nr:hypothetical protein DYH52_11505 [Morganella morganii]
MHNTARADDRMYLNDNKDVCHKKHLPNPADMLKTAYRDRKPVKALKIAAFTVRRINKQFISGVHNV